MQYSRISCFHAFWCFPANPSNFSHCKCFSIQMYNASDCLHPHLSRVNCLEMDHLLAQVRELEFLSNVMVINDCISYIPSSLRTHKHTPPHSLLHPHRDKATAKSSASALQEQNNSVSARVTELGVEVLKLRKDLEEEPRVVPGDVSGERLSREVARVLRERNEYKEN